MMLQHFRGNLDNWDPALTDALASEREVILVDYPGVGSSRGEFGPSIADTARHMIAFITALGLDEIDLARLLDRRVRRAGDRAGPADSRPAAGPGGDRSEGGAGDARLAR